MIAVLNISKNGVKYTSLSSDITEFIATIGCENEADIDIQAFLLGKDRKVIKDCVRPFVYYGNKIAPGLQYSGDNRSGGSEAECIIVRLSEIPKSTYYIAFSVTIYNGHNLKQNFGNIGDCYIKLLDITKKEELINIDLTDNYSTETGVIGFVLKRIENDVWDVVYVGQSYGVLPYTEDLEFAVLCAIFYKFGEVIKLSSDSVNCNYEDLIAKECAKPDGVRDEDKIAEWKEKYKKFSLSKRIITEEEDFW